MAEGKKTFIFYSDWINMIREMDNEDAGELLKHILSYVNDEEPETNNKFVKMAFGHMKPLIKTDLKKWDNIRLKRKASGAKGGKQTQANAKQMLEVAKQVQPVNVNVNDNINIIEEEYILQPLNLFIDEVKKGYHAQAIEQWYMELKLKKGTLTSLLTETFKGQLLTDEKVHDNTQDLKKHFKSWLNVMDRNGKLNQYKIKPKGSL